MDKLVPRKRAPLELDADPHGDPQELAQFLDPQEMLAAVILTLQTPDDATNVALTYANDKLNVTEVQAYAKIAGHDWTYYVKLLAISIGRNTEGAPLGAPQVEIDLGPAKVVLRQHALITYNLDLRCWEFKVFGRNGARVDGTKITPLPLGVVTPTPLQLGAILDIGGTQMIFILPDLPPKINRKMLTKCLARYKEVAQKLDNGYYKHQPIKPFQMFDNGHLASANAINTTAAVLATLLQNNLDQDLSKEELKDIKPPYLYATMITQAILSNEDGVLSLSEIYDWILSHYAYYKYLKTGWQNLIRHNLSLNKAFEKVPRRPNEPGKGMKWQILELYKQEFLKNILNGQHSKLRRGLLVLRQLHLHLAMHKQLPELSKYYDKQLQAHPPKDANQSPVLAPGQPQQQPPPHPQQLPPQNAQFQFPPGMYQAPLPAHQGPTAPPPQQLGAQYPQFQPTHSRTNSLPKILPQQIPQLQPYPPYQQLGSAQFFPHHQRGLLFGSTMPGLFPGGPLSNTPQGPLMFALLQLTGLLLPLRQAQGDSGTTPKLRKVGNSGVGTPLAAGVSTMFNLPPPTTTNGMPVQALLLLLAPSTNADSTNNPSQLTLATLATLAGADIGFASPKKVAQLEAFTPERGPKLGQNNKDGQLRVNAPSQLLPAFWNFVQFSTPNGQTPLRKPSDEGDQGSPTMRKLKEKDDA